MNNFLLKVVTIFTGLVLSTQLYGYEQAYSKTTVGEIEIVDLPPARLIEAGEEGDYFSQSSTLFRSLFKYIKENEIAMTVPVEGDLTAARMRFFVGDDAPAEIDSTESVSVVEMPARRVASIGGKGSYKEKNVSKVREKLESWLENQADLEQAGEAYAVFWNAPFTPWFLKRFDVHIPVREKKQGP